MRSSTVFYTFHIELYRLTFKIIEITIEKERSDGWISKVFDVMLGNKLWKKKGAVGGKVRKQ